MGAKIQAYFDQAKQLGGLKATMRLAMLTGVGSKDAAGAAESPDVLGKFNSALAEIQKEFK